MNPSNDVRARGAPASALSARVAYVARVEGEAAAGARRLVRMAWRVVMVPWESVVVVED